MIVKRVLIVLLLVLVLVLVACTPTPQPSEYDNLVENIRAAGGVVIPNGEITQPFLSVKGNIIKVDGQDIQVFEYASIQAASDDAALVSPDGSSVGTTMITWTSDPHFYKSGKLIVIYIGTGISVINVLKNVLGAQFAGRTTTLSPEVNISEPLDGATVPAGDVKVSIQVSNFSVVSKLGQPNAPGEGHIHYYLDAEPPTTPGQPAVSAAGTYAATTEMSHTWQNVTPGGHTLGVQLVNNNHTPLEPPLVAKVTVNVEAPAPSTSPTLKILSPAEGATLPTGAVTVTIEVTNFSIVNKLGQPNAPGEGHIHYYLDAEPPTTPGQPAVSVAGTYAATTEMSHTWQNVTPGSHTLGVQLVNNNHIPLEPPVVAKITVNVSSSTGQPVTINLTAQNFAFDKSTVTVPAGASITMVFNNKDSALHNFALYETSAAQKSIFVGQIITATTIEYKFTAPTTLGTYFFRCDVHPATMTGSFVVSAASSSDGGGGGY